MLMLFLGNLQSIRQSFTHQRFVRSPFVKVLPCQTFALYGIIQHFLAYSLIRVEFNQHKSVLHRLYN